MCKDGENSRKENRGKRLWERLEDYSSGNVLPMHMPGHKRNIEAFDWLKELGAERDITEIDGFDNLNEAEGILLRAQERAAALWGAKRSFFLVNGSTGGILASVRAALMAGGEVLAVRNCHKSVYHALELCGNPVHFLLPEWDESFGIFGSVLPEQVEAELQKYPRVCLVILTSPTYEGVCSDVASIVRICHAHGAVLLVDAAHGAHLEVCGGKKECRGVSESENLERSDLPGKENLPAFPLGAVACGADLVVESLHKTLPSLTQTAILHWNSTLLPVEEVARQAAIFQSSSPSYLLTASMDGCVDYLEKNAEEAGQLWLEAIDVFRSMTAGLHQLRVLGSGEDKKAEHPFFAFDPSKLVISVRGTGLTGDQMMSLLREKYQIELEMKSSDYVLAMTGMGDRREALMRLAQALCQVDEALVRRLPQEAGGTWEQNKQAGVEKQYRRKKYFLPEQKLPTYKAVAGKREKIPFSAARGRISAEYVWAYPPGIPLIIPGEVWEEELIHQLSYLQAQGVDLHSTWGGLPERVNVLF